MKNKITYLLVMFACVCTMQAQDLGKVIIRNGNASYPGFIASLNGVRLSNDYAATICFDYLEERNYRVKLLQAGSSSVMSFMVNSAPNYVSRYILNRDNAGSYALILESKALVTSETEAPTQTLAPMPETTLPSTVISPMPDADYNDMLKAVKKESLESARFEMAKTFFGKQNLSSAQVLGILKAFSLENTKVNFAKFAYPRTLDKSNYYKVYEAFSLSGSKKDMSEFIKNNP